MTAAAAVPHPGRLAGLVVLVVEDDRGTLEVFRQLLEAEGAAVRAVPDAEAALYELAARASPPDVVVADLSLPGLSGFELAERVRADARSAAIPVVAVSGLTTMSDIVRAMDAGFAAHLPKPVDAETLAVTILRVREDARREALRGRGRPPSGQP